MARIFWRSLVLLPLLALPAQAAPHTVELKVSGMTCASCPFTVRLALKKTSGVIDAKVTLDPPAATVTYDDARTSPEQLMRATANAGYPSSLKTQQ